MKKIFLTKAFFIFCAVLFANATEKLQAQTDQAVNIIYRGNGGYSLVERTNLRKYQNGKYIGLTSREVRSFISPSLPPSKKYRAKGSIYEKDQWYDGSFYVMEETLRNNQAASAGIHDSILSMFHISPDGKLTMHKDNGYPSFRSFPAYTLDKVKPGDIWKAEAERSVDPLNKGVFTKMPMLVRYTFDGAEEYKGKPVYRIKALWQTAYGGSKIDPAGDRSLVKAGGGHKADIIVLQSTGEPVLIIDNVDETFVWVDGTQINFKGTITLFTEFPPAVDTQKIMGALNRVATVKKDKAAVPEVASTKGITTAAPRGPCLAVSSEEFNEALNEGAVAANKVENAGKTAGKPDDNGGVNAGKKKAGKDSVVAAEKFDISDDIPDENPAVSSSGKKTGAEGKTSGKNKSVVEEKALAQVIPEKVSEEIIQPKNNIVAEETPAGIRLSVRDIKFKPDSADLVPGESARLDEIASVLKLAPNGQFLVEGHTASVGKPAGEQKLSELRAHRIAEELAGRGVRAAAFICRGWGGNRPVASNETDAGRAQNRRVEITILK